MTTPTISIILPVYNSEKYIRACLDSIIAQTFSDFEVILVDDGSPDNAGLICDEYAKKDQRFHVFHQENKGVSAARNKGLENSKGEWITFIDPDDLIKPNYLKNLYDAIADDIDLVIAGHERIKEGESDPFLIIKPKEKKFIPPSNFLKEEISGHAFAPYAKLIKKQNIENSNLKFDEKISLCEDIIFNLHLLLESKTLKIIPATDYIYIIHNNSLISKNYTFDNEYYIYKTRKNLYLKLLKNKLPSNIYNTLNYLLKRPINSIYIAPHKLPKAERLANLERIFKNEADVIDNLPAKNRLKRMRHNLPALDRYLDSQHNGILKYVLKLKIKLSNARKAIKSIFVKKQKTKIIEI